MAINLRAAAAKIIDKLLNNEGSLKEMLQDNHLQQFSDSRDRALVKEICFGVCRHYFFLLHVAKQFMQKPVKDQLVHSLILIGLYQLHYLRIPTHAVVAETVTAARQLKKNWATGFLNGILRSYIREANDLALADELTELSHPNWIIRQIKQDWPLHWLETLQNNNQRAALSLRINRREITRPQYMELLSQAGITAELGMISEDCIRLAESSEIEDLPGYFRGLFSVQDEAAQLAVSLLDLKATQRVLDACAAPGGKTCHMQEWVTDLSLLALDNNAKRLPLIAANCQRLKVNAIIKQGDAAETDWWDKQLFDRILLDAPCSATGVIRRHPDIKLLRKAEEIAKLANQQLQILSNLWTMLKPGGLLLYATCSIFKMENEQVIATFLTNNDDASERKITADWGLAQQFGRQILPGMNQMDGFYYCLLEKK